MNGKRTAGRLLALLLALCQCAGLFTVSARAAEEEYRYEKLSYMSVISGSYIEDSCYYTDEWFLADSTARSDSLALLSAQLALTTADAQRCAEFLQTLGFTGVFSARYESADPDDCGYTMGQKTLGNGRTLIAVAFQGADYGDEGWQQNVTVGPGGAAADHGAYAAAVDTFLEDLSGIAMPEDGILWITGSSRGGGIANLACASLLDRYAALTVHGYTFESPATTDNPEAQGEKYRSIHNYICSDDPVTMLPPWGMTRYGEDIEYDGGTVTEELLEMLGRLNPDALAFAEQYDAAPFGGDVGAYLRGLLARLTADIPTRAEYSRLRTDTLPDGTPVAYSYQEGLQALCHVIFGGGTDGIGDVLTDNLFPLLSGGTYAVLAERCAEKTPADGEALLAEGALRRWEAAGSLHKAAAKDLPSVTQADLYALLKLLGPLLTNTRMAEKEGWVLPTWDEYTKTGEMWIYVDMSAYDAISANANTLVFSHHPDMLLARLKLLAPAPEMGGVSLEIPAPQPGDDLRKAGSDAALAADALGYSWLEGRGEWLTEDDALREGKTYYLRVTLDALGHSVPEGFSFSLNGQEPVCTEVAYTAGTAQISGIWGFALGTPRQVTVSFETGGHGEPPEDVLVNEGELLRYTQTALPDPGIVRDALGVWRFDGWKSVNGDCWDTLTASADLTLCAAWTQLIDAVALTCDIPFVGDGGSDLLQLKVPDGAPYSLEIGALLDGGDRVVEAITRAEPLHVGIRICPHEGARFLTRDENGEPVFDGVFTVNGEPVESPLLEYAYTGSETANVSLFGVFRFIPQLRYDPIPYWPVPDEPYPPETDTAEENGESTDPAEDLPFIDVLDGTDYAEAVSWAWRNGITTGTDETHFSPEGAVTRGQMAAFLWRAAGSPMPQTAEAPFRDITESDYFYQAVLWAAEQGITCGTGDGRFSPDAQLDRAQAVVFLYRFVQSKGGGFAGPWSFPPDYADAGEVPEYSREAFSFLIREGLIEGSDGRLMPGESCRRGQLIAALFRLIGK